MVPETLEPNICWFVAFLGLFLSNSRRSYFGAYKSRKKEENRGRFAFHFLFARDMKSVFLFIQIQKKRNIKQTLNHELSVFFPLLNGFVPAVFYFFGQRFHERPQQKFIAFELDSQNFYLDEGRSNTVKYLEKWSQKICFFFFAMTFNPSNLKATRMTLGIGWPKIFLLLGSR